MPIEVPDYQALLFGGLDTSGGLAVNRQRRQAVINSAFDAVPGQVLCWRWYGGEVRTEAFVPSADGEPIAMPVLLEVGLPPAIALGSRNSYLVVRPLSQSPRLAQLAVVVMLMLTQGQRHWPYTAVLSPPIPSSIRISRRTT